MSRHLFFALLLCTVMMADDKPKAQREAGSGGTQHKTEAAAPDKHQQTASDAAPATDAGSQAQSGSDAELISVPGSKALGMSILGNQDAPKSLVIVPWKSSELGDSPDISPMLDDSRQPVDKEVFMRALRYYEIRSGKKH